EEVFGTYDATAGIYTLVWDRRPRTEYCVTVTDYVTDDYGRALTTPADFCFETGDLPEVLVLPAEADVVSLTADRPSALNLVARNVAAATFSLSEVTVPAVTGADPGGGEIVRRWSEAFNLTPNTMEPVTVTLRRLGGALPTGLYELAWQLPGDAVPVPPVSVAVVDRHVMVKLSDSEAVVWVADLSTGAPVTRTEVQLLDADGLLIAGGTTDADGLARLPRPSGGGLDDVLVSITGQPGAEGFGFALTTSRNSIVPRQFGVPADLGPQPFARAFVHADRSITLPGQRVQISGFVREDLGGEYRPLGSGESITLTLRGPNDVVVDRRSLPLSETGRFETAVFLSESLPAGAYAVDVVATAPGQGAGTVTLAGAAITVMPGGAPEFAVHVTADNADILEGAKARFVVQTDDLSGGVVAGATLTWSVYAEPHEFAPTVGAAVSGATADGWVWHSPTGEASSRLVAGGTAVADGSGRYVLELPATLVSLIGDGTAASAGATGAAGPQLWRAEVVATAAEDSEGLGAAAVGSSSLIVHAAEAYLGLLPKSRVVRVKERLAIDLLMVDWLGNGLGEQEVLLQLERRTWTQRPEDGTWVRTDVMISEQTVTTSESGIVSAAFTAPRSGTYVVKAASGAARGREAWAEAHLWVGGAEGGDWLVDNAALSLVADRHSYQAGDVAKILVPASFVGPYELLLTVERDGIVAVERLTVEGPNPILEIPVLDTYHPNVYVSCVLLRPGDEVRQPRVYVGYLNLPVAASDQYLTVDVIPTGRLFAPGDRAEVLVRTLDQNGRPVSADVTLAVLEETVQRPVDRGTASLADAFYGERPLRVLTGDALLAPGNRGPGQSGLLAYTVPIPGALGGVVPFAASGGTGGVIPRSAVWNASLRTDSDGEVVVAFALPDAETTWAVTAWAITEEAAVGQGRAMLSTEKPLSVQPIAPRYLVAGDRAEIAALVHNGTGEDQVVDMELAEAVGLTVEGISVQRMTLAAGETSRVAWPVLVATSGARELKKFGEPGHQNGSEFVAAARIVARSGDYAAVGVLTDALTGAAGLPIHQLRPLDTFAVAGSLDAETWVEVFDVPEEVSDATTLVLRIDATLGSFLANGLASNVRSMDLGLPDTTGAWVDELLPAVSIYDALSAMGLESEKSEPAAP
ncbi:MAG: MG2 domain-containing protein, partial [Anaerolineae bacterium]|nr:MG2 domain-containing protein [Anaerolineae bacterium]